MKKIISLILCAVMLTSVLVFDTSAAGTLVFNDDFSTGFPPRNWITDSGVCAFSWDGVDYCIHGYSDAVMLQSQFNAPYNKKWDDFYASMDFRIKADDDKGDGEDTYVGIWYCDTFNNDATNGAVYEFRVCVQTGEATLEKTYRYSYKDENDITQENFIDDVIAGPVSINDTIEVGETAEWFSLGLRVTDGVMQCYYNETLIFDLKASEDDEKIGGVALKNIDATVGTVKSPILFVNIGNWVAMDNFEVWTADYDFSPVINYGDVDGSGTVNLLDASAIMKYAAGWTSVELVEQVADVDLSGTVNLLDASLVMKYAAKWDVNLGE